VEIYPDADDYSEWEPSDSSLAFAAYADAWRVRESTGDITVHPLIAALEARRVDRKAWAEGTDLRATLWSAWERGRPPHRLHGAILRYRWRRVRAFPAEVRALFSSDLPADMQRPEGLAPTSTWTHGEEDETELTFAPSALFRTRVHYWFEAADDGEGDRYRLIPVWLDCREGETHTAVMIGAEIAGLTQVPPEHHRILTTARRRRKRIVADGELAVKRRKDGTYRPGPISVTLVDLDDL